MIKTKLARGLPLPEWALNEPLLEPDELWYASAFSELNTTRKFAGGPIPWTAIQELGHASGLDENNIKALLVVIRAMDDVFLKFQERKHNSGQSTSKGNR